MLKLDIRPSTLLEIGMLVHPVSTAELKRRFENPLACAIMKEPGYREKKEELQ